MEGSASVDVILQTQKSHPATAGFFVLRRYMNQVNKFYLKYAVYQVEVDGVEVVLLMNYSGNTYEVMGNASAKIREMAVGMLAKKHGVNFAYKFNAKMESKI